MRKLLLSAMALLLSSALMAGPVGKDEAQSKALAFLNGKVSTQTNGSARVQRRLQNLSLAASEKAYHVFNVDENGGFVIVSGSDLTPDIIGYADEGSFDAQNIPDNMKAWLAGYAEQIASAESQGVAVRDMKKVASVKSSIAPLIQTKWDQGSPYNNSCPDFFTFGKCVTGCVATAMAQVLYYRNQKDGVPMGTTKTIDAYDCSTTWGGGLGKVHVSACPTATFEWSKMRTSYSGSETADEKSAVAKLMQYCGASVNMEYANSANGGSQASVGNIPEALQTYFGFDRNVRFENRKNYTEAEWEDLIYNEVANGRPVIYGGMSAGGGHGFVCDGYDADGLFHVNWGWGGAGNGYFLLTSLAPNVLGIGGGNTADGFTMNQQVVVGIQKPTGKAEEDGPITMIMEELNYTGDEEVSKSASTMHFEFNGKLRADFSYTYTFKMGLAVYDGATRLKVIEVSNMTCAPAKNYMPAASMIIPMATLNDWLPENKTYQLKLATKLDGSSEWVTCTNSEGIYVQATVTDTKIAFSAVSPVVNLKASDIVLATDGVVNTLQTVTATIENKATDVYRSNVYMFVNGEKAAGYGIDVKSGGKGIATFRFKPTTVGVKAIKITTDEDGTKEIGSGTITIGTPTGDDSPVLTHALKMNVEDGKILGSKLKAVLTLTNTTSNDYVGEAIVVLLHEKGGGYWEGDGISYPVSVPASSSVDVSYEYDATGYSNYRVQAQYKHSGALTDLGSSLGVFTVTTDVISYLKADGKEEIVLKENPFKVPDDAAVVDLRGMSVVTVTPNSNPNCIYLADGGATVTGVTNNVVKGTTAANLVLTDDDEHGFYSPINFKATKVTYKRTFTNGYNTTDKGGWSTLTVPFNVTEVSVGGTPIDWFKSNTDTGKNFWVHAFSSDDKDQVTFTWTDEIKANTPYIINVPVGDEWGSNNLKDKEITFEGSDVSIKATEKSTLSGSYYMFAGSTQMVADATDYYQLNAAGKKFEKGLATQVEPFRAYFYASSRDLFGSVLSIGFENAEEATGIAELKSAVKNNVKSEGWYTLTGVKLNGAPVQKGVYLHNGKKVNVR